jgi:DNA polymerase I-like protein with 3'-5' exonuclease and polymerase domains
MPYIDCEGDIPTGLDSYTTYQAYNVLDSAVTAQLCPIMLDKLNDNHKITYARERRVLALCLELSTKGLPIEQISLAELLYVLEKDERRSLHRLHQYCEAVDARPINPRSSVDVPWLFYEHLGLPAVYEYDRKTKQRKVTSDIKALEKLRDNYPIAIPLVNAILAVREASKMASVFKRGLEPTASVLRCNFTPTGTETGRLSSQQNPYGRGTNAQNLTDRVRQVICAPDGYAILNLDLKTAESIAVGFLSGCRAYIDACFGGDLHTAVTRMTWPGMAWTGDLKQDRALAETIGYRHFTWRDLAKREGHATNYYGTPTGIAQQVKIPKPLVEEFQRGYLSAFIEISEWHLDVIARIQQDGIIITPLNRERRFWGRPDDAATHREAIAFAPQSLVGDVMNEGLYEVQRWLLQQCREARVFLGRGKRLLPFKPTVADLRAQVHDAGVFLVPIEALDTIAPMVQSKLQFPVDFGDLGAMIIPSDMMVGKRWNKAPKSGGEQYMREGLKDWKPGQKLHWL